MSFRTEQFKFTTLQAMLDEVVLKTLEQGVPSYDGRVCCYRTEKDGKTVACAVGQLMTDSEAASFPNSISFYDPTLRPLKDKWGLTTEASRLLTYIQEAHDGSFRDDNFSVSFRKSATDAVARFNELNGTNLVMPSWYSKSEQAAAYRRVADWIEANPGRLISGALKSFGAGDAATYCAVGVFGPTNDLKERTYYPGFFGTSHSGVVVPPDTYMGSIAWAVARDSRSLRNSSAEFNVLGDSLVGINDSSDPKERESKVVEACRKVADYLDGKPVVEAKEPESALAPPAKVKKPHAPAQPGSVRWMAKKLRESAALLESGDCHHVAYTEKLDASKTDGQKPCYCAVGALGAVSGGAKFNDMARAFAPMATLPFKRLCGHVAKSLASNQFDSGYFEDQETIINVNDAFGLRAAEVRFNTARVVRVLRPEDSKLVCRFLRTLARELEHGGLARFSDKEGK